MATPSRPDESPPVAPRQPAAAPTTLPLSAPRDPVSDALLENRHRLHHHSYRHNLSHLQPSYYPAARTANQRIDPSTYSADRLRHTAARLVTNNPNVSQDIMTNLAATIENILSSALRPASNPTPRPDSAPVSSNSQDSIILNGVKYVKAETQVRPELVNLTARYACPTCESDKEDEDDAVPFEGKGKAKELVKAEDTGIGGPSDILTNDEADVDGKHDNILFVAGFPTSYDTLEIITEVMLVAPPTTDNKDVDISVQRADNSKERRYVRLTFNTPEDAISAYEDLLTKNVGPANQKRPIFVDFAYNDVTRNFMRFAAFKNGQTREPHSLTNAVAVAARDSDDWECSMRFRAGDLLSNVTLISNCVFTGTLNGVLGTFPESYLAT